MRDGSRHSFSCFRKFSKGFKVICHYVASQSCYDRSLHWENIKTNFWNGTNTTWENLKEGVWRLGNVSTLSRPSYESLVCNHVLNTIQNIIWDIVHIRKTYV